MEAENFNIKEYIGRFILCLCALAAAVIAGYLLLVLAYLIPTGPMQPNMVESCGIFEKEGTYPKKLWNYNSRLDNFTDGSMLLMSSTETDEGVWKAALLACTRSLGDQFPDKVLLSIYRDGAEDYTTYAYPRYWQGYMVFVKPLIYLFPYRTIRLIVLIWQLMLMSILLYQTYKYDKRLIFPVLGMWAFLNPVATLQSLQFNTVLSITLISLIHIVSYKRKHEGKNMRKWDIAFLLAGCATSYFDLLTFPLLSWGVPLAVWLYLYSEDDLKKNILNEIELSFCWGMGYAGMWASKWVLANLITGQDVITNATNEASGWMNTDIPRMLKYFYALARNCGAAVQIVIVIYIAFLLYKIVCVIRKNRIDAKQYLCYMIIFVAPFAWYFVTVSHAYRHYWFTYRNMGISIISLTLIVLKISEESDKI